MSIHVLSKNYKQSSNAQLFYKKKPRLFFSPNDHPIK